MYHTVATDSRVRDYKARYFKARSDVIHCIQWKKINDFKFVNLIEKSIRPRSSHWINVKNNDDRDYVMSKEIINLE